MKRRHRWRRHAGALLGLALTATAAPERPDVLIILADDMGYSDIGCYGGEIPTPHLDALAAGGLRLTQFYNAARCSPTRAALLTGVHPHEAGMGILAEDQVQRAPDNAGPGYRRYLAPEVMTLAELLRPAGYATALSGKWHLGFQGEEKRPLARGFDHFYGLLAGSSSYHRPAAPRPFTRGHEMLPPPEDPEFYATDAIAGDAIRFLRTREKDEPFFLYLAFTAPHWPLHARTEDIAKFTGRYREGWDVWRERRFARQRELGIIPDRTRLSPRDDGVRAWSDLTTEEQGRLDFRMAVYAAQVHRMDWNIGRVIAALRELGRLHNTLVIFLSDNGASAEPYTDAGGGVFEAVNRPGAFGLGSARDPAGGSSYGTGWANVSNTPFRRYKSRLHEGGVRTPLIVHWPAGLHVTPGAIDHRPGDVTDLVPTVLELAGIGRPLAHRGEPMPPLRGRSLVPRFAAGKAETDTPRDFYWEQYGHRAMRRGDWKAVRTDAPDAAWELYRLDADGSELENLAAVELAKLAEMIDAWEAWAAASQVWPVTRD